MTPDNIPINCTGTLAVSFGLDSGPDDPRRWFWMRVSGEHARGFVTPITDTRCVSSMFWPGPAFEVDLSSADMMLFHTSRCPGGGFSSRPQTGNSPKECSVSRLSALYLNPTELATYQGEDSHLVAVRVNPNFKAAAGLSGRGDEKAALIATILGSAPTSPGAVACADMTGSGFESEAGAGTRFESGSDFGTDSKPEATLNVQANTTPLNSGLHPMVQYDLQIDLPITNVGNGADGGSGGGFTLTNSLMLLQLLPETAYLDLDELRSRHDFEFTVAYNSSPSHASESVITTFVQDGFGATVLFPGDAIDIEKPASVSSQHAVAVLFHNPVLAESLHPQCNCDQCRQVVSVGLRLPYHVRYPTVVSEPSRKVVASVPPPMLLYQRSSCAGCSEWRVANLIGQRAPVELDFPPGEGWRAEVVTAVTATSQAVALGMVALVIIIKRHRG